MQDTLACDLVATQALSRVAEDGTGEIPVGERTLDSLQRQPEGRHNRSPGRESWVSESHRPESPGDGTIRPRIRAGCATPEGVRVVNGLLPRAHALG